MGDPGARLGEGWMELNEGECLTYHHPHFNRPTKCVNANRTSLLYLNPLIERGFPSCPARPICPCHSRGSAHLAEVRPPERTPTNRVLPASYRFYRPQCKR